MFLVTREIGGLMNGMLYVCKEVCVCVCMRSEVPSNKEKLLKAPFDLHLLFISVFPDMFFFPALADVFPLIVSSKW